MIIPKLILILNQNVHHHQSLNFFPLRTHRRRGCRSARSGTALPLIYWPLVQGPNEVQKLWGQTARNSLNNILTEFDDLFMKHKADFAKHKVEVEPGATHHREVARRIPRDKAERAN